MPTATGLRIWQAGCHSCPWTIVSWRQEWAVSAGRTHHTAHLPTHAEQYRARYRYRGTLNATQRDLLQLAATLTLRAWATRVTELPEGHHGDVFEFGHTRLVWVPADRRPHGGHHWVNGLHDAGLLRVLPTWGEQHGLYLLTPAGRRALTETATP
jgi:hypothetical protein